MEKKNQSLLRQFGLSSASINNRMTVMVILVILVIAGVASYIGMPREAFPEVVVPQIYVGTPYPGNSPVDIETGQNCKGHVRVETIDRVNFGDVIISIAERRHRHIGVDAEYLAYRHVVVRPYFTKIAHDPSA